MADLPWHSAETCRICGTQIELVKVTIEGCAGCDGGLDWERLDHHHRYVHEMTCPPHHCIGYRQRLEIGDASCPRPREDRWEASPPHRWSSYPGAEAS